MFVIRFKFSPYILRGFLSGNGKVYFSAVDVGYITHAYDIVKFADSISSCLAENVTDVFAGPVVEHRSLLQILDLLCPDSKFSNLPEFGMLSLFYFGGVTITKIEDDIIFMNLDEEGSKTFDMWVRAEKTRIELYLPNFV